MLVGNGAREHSIAWKLAQSPLLSELMTAPGNGGTGSLGRNVDVGAEDIDGLLALATDESVDLTVIGPEAPLAGGIVDRFNESGLPVFGPTRAAARIESSKAYAKELMQSNGIPTGAATVFTDYSKATKYVANAQPPIVIKADGLAAGKGVVVADSREDALTALQEQMEERKLGAAGDSVLVEEYLEGPEISVFAFVSGEYISPMIAACDYKRALDGDIGPNTGGMGSYSPPAAWGPELENRVRKTIMEPAARALADDGAPYTGVLYAGLVLTAEGPKVIEFNCRLGDPESQVVLPKLNSDLLEVMLSGAEGRLSDTPVVWGEQACVAVVMASGGYPGAYETGFPIDGLTDVDDDVLVFHAGTKADSAGNGASLETSGGRVLTVAATGRSVSDARAMAYENIGRIRFNGAHYRRDIAAGV